jgi:eukaryotic-like serine/threonine-protein kinase
MPELAYPPPPAPPPPPAQFGQSLVQTAEKLPRPEPLPLLSSGLFDTPADELRAPDDPTGGVVRPGAGRSDAVEDLVLVTLDEPDPPSDSGAAGEGADPDVDDTVADVPPADAPLDGPVADPGITGTRTGSGTGTGTDAVDAPIAAAPLDPLLAVAASGAGRTEPGAGLTRPSPAGSPTRAAADTSAPAVAGPSDDGPSGGEPSGGETSGGEPSGSETSGGEPVDVEPPTHAGGADPGEPAHTDADATLVAPAVAEDDDSARRGGMLVRVLLAVVLLAALVGLAVLAVRLFSTPSYDVPDLTGIEQAAALQAIEDFNWDVTIDNERSDEEPRPGRVVRTVPSAGDRLARGEPFLLVVSEGPEFRTLPDLIGLSFVDAEARLVALALDPTVVDAFDEEVPRGGVVSWTVPDQPELVAGDQVLPGTEVTIVASLGPAPRTVPDLVGLTAAVARSRLDDLRLEMDEADQVFDDVVPPGQIVSQSPEPGDEVERGATVTITVSRGPDLVLLPPLEGLTFAEAQAALAEAGFTVRLVLGASDGAFVSAAIDGQPAQPGAPYRRGSQVDVVFL